MGFHGRLPAADPNIGAWASAGAASVTSPPAPLPLRSINVSAYSALLLVYSASAGGPVAINFFFSLTQGGAAIGPTYEWASAGSTMAPITVPVEGPFINFVLGAADVTLARGLALFGSTTEVLPHARDNGFSTGGFEYSTGAVAMIAGNTYGLGTLLGKIFQGPAYAEFELQGSLTGKGWFIQQMQGSEGVQNFGITDTAETGWHPIAGQTIQALTKHVAFPALPYSFAFICSVGATMAAVVRAIPDY